LNWSDTRIIGNERLALLPFWSVQYIIPALESRLNPAAKKRFRGECRVDILRNIGDGFRIGTAREFSGIV
jgi:hypothetical protein